MKKLFSLAIIFIASHFIGNAQTTRFGFTAGTAFANYKSKVDGETDNANSKKGITAGVLIDIPAGNHFSFQPAVNFVQKGTKDEETSGGVTEKAKITVNCIEVPLNFLYNVCGNNGNFFIGAGPSLAFALSGKLKFDDGTNSVSEDIKFGSGENDDMKGLDLAANFITGYCFHNGLLFSVNYNAGLSNLSPGGSNDDTVKSHYFGIKLGYLLNSKGKK
jgi:Outer membrane protein beta-barrel domain